MADIVLDFYANAYGKLGYDAVGMGEYESKAIREIGPLRLYGPNVRLVSANVLDSRSGKPATGDSFIVKKLPGGMRAGIVSVVAERALAPQVMEGLGLRVIPPAEALAREVPKIRKKADIVIVLSHADSKTTRDLVNAIPDIDVVLVGNPDPQADTPPEQLGSTILMQARSQGKSIGRLVLDIGPDRNITSSSGQYVEMGRDMADDPEIAALVAQFDKDVTERNLSYADKGPKAFVSNRKCRECHAEEYFTWEHTEHAHAFDSLKGEGRARDPECVGCHTVGYKLPGGFKSEAATPDYKHVGCETCHGAGVIHSRSPAPGYGAVSENTCRACHDKPNSPDFDYTTYLERVSHKKVAARKAELQKPAQPGERLNK